MPSWFSKAFEKKSAPQHAAPDPMEEAASFLVEETKRAEDELFSREPPKEPRKVISAPVILNEEPDTGSGSGVRIKARLDEAKNTCTFLVDRPVLHGLSFWAPNRETANTHSPLAAAIFDVGGIDTVLVHETNITVTRDGSGRETWEDKAREIGAQIRAHLESGVPVVSPEFLDQLPGEEEVRTALQVIIDEKVNPGIASHSGVITLDRVVGNTAYITMGGGCQGCAASSITLRSGVEGMFRDAVPQLGALLDETDHQAGTNPYFSELPAGMGG